MTEWQKHKIGRLAMREEGQMWVAYYAMMGTMASAIWLGSIQMRFVQNRERKLAFMNMMREAVGDIMEEATGVRPMWGGVETASEAETAKN